MARQWPERQFDLPFVEQLSPIEEVACSAALNVARVVRYFAPGSG
jgi:hypothetical protein